MVGGCSEQKKSDHGLRINCRCNIRDVLDIIFCKVDMKKIGPYLLLMLTLAAACSSKKERRTGENVPTTSASAVNDLPAISLTKLNGDKFTGKSLEGQSVILILFQASCDHCQREAKQIKMHIESFRSYHLYFISADTPAEATKFASDYKLADEPNVTFALTDVPGVLNSFGPVSTPSVYIYNAAGKLMAKFNGETDINLILKKL